MKGHSFQRPDAVAKVTGRARYTDDFSMPGMRHAAYVRSTQAHALLVSIDSSAALALPGVEAVFTAADVPDILFPTAGHPHNLDPARADVADKRLLTDHARFFGDEVAVVVARDELTARKAAALVRVEYQPLPVLTSPEAALAEGAPLIHPELALPGGNLLGQHTLAVGGDVDDGLARAHEVARAHVHTPLVQHCQLENQTAYAYMEDEKHIVIVSSTQIPHICRRITGQALGIPWAWVRVIKPCVGGGFGNKQDVILEPMVAFLSMKLGGRAVRMALEREECMLATRTRHPFDVDCQVGLCRDGVLTALDLDAVSHTGAYASHGHSIASAGGSKLCVMYPHVPYRYRARTVYLNTPTAGAMRGYGSPQVCFAMESALDDAAHLLHLDPLDVRLKNAGKPGDPSPLNGTIMHTHGLAACLQRGAEYFDWKARRAACAQGRDDVLSCARDYALQARPGFSGLREDLAHAHTQAPSHGPLLVRGVGVASFSYATGTYPVNVEVAGARLSLNQDGVLQLMCGATEIGQGADAVFAQMAASTLGLDYDVVRVISTQDTDVFPYDPGAFASRQTFVNGHAVKACALRMKDVLLESAALVSGRPVAGLALAGRHVIAENGELVLSLAELGQDSFYHKDRGAPLTAESAVKAKDSPPAFGCTFAEVEVDILLCRVRVTRLLNVHDAGLILNPLLAEGQVKGGMAMGLGMALQEELLVDGASGRVWNANLLDYKVPVMPDMPDLECLFVEEAEPTSAYGTKALGEPPLIGPAPAIRNAVLDATGVLVHEIPLTPKLLFRHFRAAGLV